MSIDYDELDPGIRDLVRELNAYGFETSDSGDGVSKPADARELNERHVFIMTDQLTMVVETERLKSLYPDAWVELSWAPPQEPNIMILPDGTTPPEGYTTREEMDKT